MPILNWGMIQDGGTFESLMHAILYTEDEKIILFGRPGRDAGQDARSAGGTVVYQAKYRQGMTMDGAVSVALEELENIKKYRQSEHANYGHWQNVRQWVLVANFSINPNDDQKWQEKVVLNFKKEGLIADYWDIEKLEGKLVTQAPIRDVFFGGENRVLVGLKEAYDLLSTECIGSSSLEKPMVGRETELKTIEDFATTTDKRVLPIVGPGGIGKSRLLYESLASLSGKGWRVFWALPETMAQSSRWFHLLNSDQPTCVAIDDPDHSDLLRAVIEQLATIERRNWKVIVACRSEKAEVLRRFRNNSQVADPLRLNALDEPQSKELLRTILDGQTEETWLHAVYTRVHGVPGWLCLIAELANRGSLSAWPSNADAVAADYVKSCLQSLELAHRDQGRTLLRWLALWGNFALDTSDDQPELRFLTEEHAIPSSMTRALLRSLAGTGLVRNWGVGRRMYAVEPLIIREHTLSDWLLEKTAGGYQISAEGRQFVAQLVKGQVPAVEKILITLSHLTRSRLDEPEGFWFLKPIFQNMMESAREGTLLDQYRIVQHIEAVGHADPESALDVLSSIRESHKDDLAIDVPPWGTQTFTHSALVSKLPWILFQIAESVFDTTEARRFLKEFRALIAMPRASAELAEPGKSTKELIVRLLCRSRNWGVFAQPAREIVMDELNDPDSWVFIGLLLESLLNPERQFMEWVANWKLSITKTALEPGSNELNLAVDLRTWVFEMLRTSTDLDLRCRLWRVLAESHHQFHRMVLHGTIRGDAATHYRAVLVDDLTKCVTILSSLPVSLGLKEATEARKMWSWYLKYGDNDDLQASARRCEEIYNSLSRWRLHEFFRYGTDVSPEIARVTHLLRTATGPDTFEDFFKEAESHIRQSDMADSWRISVLADNLADLFTPAAVPGNALTTFLKKVLEQAERENNPAWDFTVNICQKYLRRVKESDESSLGSELRRILDNTHKKVQLLYDLYVHPHPDSIGNPTSVEMDCILTQEQGFSLRQWFILLGGFAFVSWEKIRPRLHERMDRIRDDPAEASECMACFIRSLNVSMLRYQWPADQLPLSWIIEMIMEFDLDGTLLEMHDLTWLRDRAAFKFTMPQLVLLVRSRIDLEQKPRLSSSFQTMPHHFSVNEWCNFDAANPGDEDAFFEFCRLALGAGFIALYWMPKYIAQLDPTGKFVERFVIEYLDKNPTIDVKSLTRLACLASAYSDTSEEWVRIAIPICTKAENYRKEEREHVYFGLSRKETGVLRSTRGEVPDYYFQARDNAARMYNEETQTSNSPLIEYRKWALRRAEDEYQRAKEKAEEVDNG